jgi:hypothetical protein
MKRVVTQFLLILTTLLPLACAGEKTLPTPPQKLTPLYLKGFKIIDDAETSAIGKILEYDGDIIGSGALISSTHVLTAAHVVDNTEAYWFETKGVKYCIKETYIHPLSSIMLVDAALLVLDEPCAEPSVTIRSTSLIRGENLTVVGYGGGIRKRSNFGILWYYGTLIEDPFNLKMLCYEGTVWFGDSGGAVLDSQGNIVGIVSSLGCRRNYVYENSAVRVDLLLPWIYKTAESSVNNSR